MDQKHTPAIETAATTGPHVVYVAGRHHGAVNNVPAWELLGIFAEQPKAHEVCTTDRDFVAPMAVDMRCPEAMTEWPGARYVLRGEGIPEDSHELPMLPMDTSRLPVIYALVAQLLSEEGAVPTVERVCGVLETLATERLRQIKPEVFPVADQAAGG